MCCISVYIPVTSILPSIVAISHTPREDDLYRHPLLAIIIGLLLANNSIKYIALHA